MAAEAPRCTGWCHGLSENCMGGISDRPAASRPARQPRHCGQTDDQYEWAGGRVGRIQISARSWNSRPPSIGRSSHRYRCTLIEIFDQSMGKEPYPGVTKTPRTLV